MSGAICFSVDGVVSAYEGLRRGNMRGVRWWFWCLEWCLWGAWCLVWCLYVTVRHRKPVFKFSLVTAISSLSSLQWHTTMLSFATNRSRVRVPLAPHSKNTWSGVTYSNHRSRITVCLPLSGIRGDPLCSVLTWSVISDSNLRPRTVWRRVCPESPAARVWRRRRSAGRTFYRAG